MTEIQLKIEKALETIFRDHGEKATYLTLLHLAESWRMALGIIMDEYVKGGP